MFVHKPGKYLFLNFSFDHYILQTHVMWADSLSHFQDEAQDAALYEAEVGDHVPIHENQSDENA